MSDLFGRDVEAEALAKRHADALAAEEADRLAKRYGSYKCRGFAADPGSGPEGETCGSCKHSYAVTYARTYWKCGMSSGSHSRATDIAITAPACRLWEKA